MVTPEVYQKNTAFPSAYQQDVARSQPRVLMNSWLIEVCKYASNAICIFVTIVCVPHGKVWTHCAYVWVSVCVCL
jgi:hypothetical protein